MEAHVGRAARARLRFFELLRGLTEIFCARCVVGLGCMCMVEGGIVWCWVSGLGVRGASWGRREWQDILHDDDCPARGT